MKKKMRWPIRLKLAIMSIATISVAVATLGIFLSVSFSQAAYQTASDTLKSVNSNATLALEESLTSVETSMKLLTNQIGYNSDFANNITTVSTSADSLNKIRIALSGNDGSGDGSTIIGAMDYLLISDNDIESVTMYSPFVDEPILSRLFSTKESKVECTKDRYDELSKHPGTAMWFFKDDEEGKHLYVWRALVNYAVVDSYDMQVVGYIEYSFNRNSFLACLTDTKYENQGMMLIDENGNNVLTIASGDNEIDEEVVKNASNIKENLTREKKYTTCKSYIPSKGWTYISYINHIALRKTNARSRNVTLIIVSASIAVAFLVSYLLSSKEIKRIRNISKAANTIASGDYSVVIDEVGNDEITDVTKNFNIMIDAVKKAQAEAVDIADLTTTNFAIVVANKSNESGNHVLRVRDYSGILAQELGFSEQEVHDIKVASTLHDIGKIMIPDSVLHKPGRFTDEERLIMQQHVTYGADVLKGVPGRIMELGRNIAAYHHERYDGNGYMSKLKGEEIPKEAQIVSVADVFDALVSPRCYKGPWTLESAYDEIVSQSGKQFAPAVVEAFKARFDDFKEVYEHYKETEANKNEN